MGNNVAKNELQRNTGEDKRDKREERNNENKEKKNNKKTGLAHKFNFISVR